MFFMFKPLNLLLSSLTFINPVFRIPNEDKSNIRRENLGCSNVEIRRSEIGLENKLPKDFIFHFYNRNGLEISWEYQSYYSNFELIQFKKNRLNSLCSYGFT